MSFHLYDINELYSNADGSIQFIELKVGNFNGQDLFQGHAITATQGATTHSYTFPGNLPNSNTANTLVLIATQGFADLGIVAPNYVVPSGFLFVGGGTVDFAGVDSVVYAALPTDGTLSVDRSGASGVNSPTNFAGATGTVPAPVNHPPVLNVALPDQTATEDTAFNFTVPANAFADVDAGDTLNYSATKVGGTALPAWLAFTVATRTFSGTPTNSDVGSLDIQVSATDSASASVSDAFTITVANTNDAPTLLNALADQTAIKDTAFSFSVPANAFVDVDAGDTLSYSATKADGTALPAWLMFTIATRAFSGTPGVSDAATIDIKVTATDTSNASATDVFALTVPGDTTFTLSGKTYFWNKVAARDIIAAGHVLMDGVTVSVNDGGSAREGMTAAGGAYSVASIAAATAAVTASQTLSTADKATVTLGDALEVLKLYLGKLANLSPYKYLAADFNDDNKVSLTDALGILKSVLNKAGALEPAWVFVDEEANVSGLTKDSAARPAVDAHPVGTDPSLNLVAVLRGDANGSWKPAATTSYEVLPDDYFIDATTGLIGQHPDTMSAGQFGL